MRIKAPPLDIEKLSYGSPNTQRWLRLTEHVFSPDSYRILSWLSVISGALQRRLWFGKLTHYPLFCNTYTVLVGGPSVGKGLVQTPHKELLLFHKNVARATTRGKGELPLLFPMSPDNLTYERLVESLCENIINTKYTDVDGNEQDYVSCPMVVSLAEIESLFHEDAKKTGVLLREAFDGIDHRYETKTQDHYFVHNPLVTLLGATQPGRLPALMEMDAFQDGMASRCIFAFESKARFNTFHLKEVDQKVLDTDKPALLEHLGNLYALFGKLQYPKTTYDFLEAWWLKEIVPKQEAASDKMQNFYGRLRVNILKMAACLHFADSLERVITHACFEKAIYLFKYLEVTTDQGFNGLGRNELARFQTLIESFLKRTYPNPVSKVALFAQFVDDLAMNELEQVLQDLLVLGRINQLSADRYIATKQKQQTDE